MLYKCLSELPETITKRLSEAKQETYRQIFNSAWQEWETCSIDIQDHIRSKLTHRLAWNLVCGYKRTMSNRSH